MRTFTDLSREVDRYTAMAVHGLFVTLVIVGLLRSISLVNSSLPLFGVTLLVATSIVVCYYFGVARSNHADSVDAITVWLCGLLFCWLVSLIISSEFIWLAFVLTIVVWNKSDRWLGSTLIVVIAFSAVASFAWHTGQWKVGAVLGPLLGIASAVVMTEAYKRLRRQSEERRKLLDQLIAAQSALAIRERASGTLAERERLAQDIHDTLGQSLASVALLLRAAASTSQPIKSEEERVAQLQMALDATLSAIAETRRFIHGLAPEIIEREGLSRSLSSISAESQALGLPVEFKIKGKPRRIDTAIEVIVLRVTQEALTNARKHSAASCVSVTLTFSSREVSVCIVDNGVGFDEAKITKIRREDGSGFGLIAMRSRIVASGGILMITSSEDLGTVVLAVIPVFDDNADDNRLDHF